MGREDWYRHNTWSAEIAAAFEERLQRSRSAFGKAQYLRIQGCELIQSSLAELQQVGLDLTQRVIAEYPQQKMQATMAYETLGDYYLEQKMYREAEEAYGKMPEVMDERGNGTTEIWKAKLAKAVFLSGQREKYAAAKKMVEELILGARRPRFNSSLFECFVVLTRLSYALGAAEDTKTYARAALKMSSITTPQFARHPTVGLVKADPSVIRELEEMAEGTTQRKRLLGLFRRKR